MIKYAVQKIETRIAFLRGQKVLLSADLAQLYGVEHKVLIQAVHRNRVRFPKDFLFQLRKDEFSNLKSQFVTSNSVFFEIPSDGTWGGVRKLPYAFTEEGVAMLSGIFGNALVQSEQGRGTVVPVCVGFIYHENMM